MARVATVAVIAALIVLRVVLVSRHGASSDIALAVVIGLLLVRVALIGQRRRPRRQVGPPLDTHPDKGPFG